MSHSGWINCVLVEQIHSSRYLTNTHTCILTDHIHLACSCWPSLTQQLVPHVGGGFCWENNRLGQRTEKWKEKMEKKPRRLGKIDEGWDETMRLDWPCATHSKKLIMHFYLKMTDICVLLITLQQFNPNLGNCANPRQQSQNSPRWFPIAAWEWQRLLAEFSCRALS